MTNTTRKMTWTKDTIMDQWYADATTDECGDLDGPYRISKPDSLQFTYRSTYILRRMNRDERGTENLGRFSKLADAKAAAEADRLDGLR